MGNWTTKEINILEQHFGKSASSISKILYRNGFRRSRHAVQKALLRYSVEFQSDTLEEIPTKPPAILYFDLETTNLKGNLGDMLMMGWRWHSDETYHIKHVFDYDNWNEPPIELRDKPLIKDMAEVICAADVLVGHYSLRFDYPFIQTRCIYHGLMPLPMSVPHIDTWKIARYQLCLTSNKLRVLAKFLGCENQKGELPYSIWRRSWAHDIGALEEMSDYCIQDVRTLFDCTQMLLPIAKDMPNWNLLTKDDVLVCSGCGGKDFIQRGYYHTKVNKYPRFQCISCGRWGRGRKTVAQKGIERLIY